MAVDVDATGSNKQGWCITLTASAATEVTDTSFAKATTGTAPAVTVQAPSSRTAFVATAGHYAGAINSGQVTADASFTTVTGAVDFGSQMGVIHRITAMHSGGDITVTHGQTSSDAWGLAGVSVSEVAAAPSGQMISTVVTA